MRHHDPTAQPLPDSPSEVRSPHPPIELRPALSIALGALLWLVPTDLPAVDEIEWDFSTTAGQSSIHLDRMRRLADYVSGQTDGKFSIRINDLSGSNGGRAASLKNLRVFSFNLQDVDYTPNDLTAEKWDQFPVFGINYNELYERYSEWKTNFQSGLTQAVIDILYAVPERTSYLVSNHHIRSIEDLKGLSISVFTKDSALKFAMLGMIPQLMPRHRVSEMPREYVDIETLSVTPSANIDMGFFKNYSYFYHTHPTWSFVATGVDRQSLQRLPDDLRRIIQQASKDFENVLWLQAASLDNIYSQKLRDLGLEERYLLNDFGFDVKEQLYRNKRKKCPPYCNWTEYCKENPHLCLVQAR